MFADIGDIDKHFPGLMKATIEWFKIYKIPDGKPENQFAFDGEAKPKDFALHVIQDVHQHWLSLIKKEVQAGGIAWFVFFFVICLFLLIIIYSGLMIRNFLILIENCNISCA